MTALTTFERLVRLETRLWNDLDRALVEGGHPSLAWLGVLRIVDVTPECRVSDVSRALEITHGGLSKLADRIVAAGLLERADHRTDRRATILVLTPGGLTALARANDAADEWLAPRLQGTDTRRRLDAHLTHVRANLEENR